MLSDEILEKVTERLTNRIETLNTYIIKKRGHDIGLIRNLTPTQAQQLVQMLKFGGDYNKIINEIARITNLNTKDIKEIFHEVAKNDYQFAEKFYKYRNIGYIPYEQNTILKTQVEAIANITVRQYKQMMSPKVLGYGFIDNDENTVFKGLKKTYYDLLDEAVLSVSQGKETFDQVMGRQIKQMGGSGLKVILDSTYIDKDGKERNRTRRLDSTLRMNMKDALRTLHNETQEIFGKEFDSDGVEISVHLNPAPDHEEVQGKQFSKEEYKKLQETGIATSYDNIEIDLHRELKSGETAEGFRPISTYNCYHYIFSIILGVSEPEYTEEQLKDIIDKSNKGFEIDGKHYTTYEGTQLQRKLETEIRKQKDIQIMAKEADDKDTIREAQQKITQLTQKYRELSQKANLPTRMDRMKVSQYKRVNIKKFETKTNI